MPATKARATVASYVALTKPRIIELLLVTTVPTMIVAQRGLPPVWLMVAVIAGGALAAGGANALNMVIDRDIDSVMQRTQGRPLVTGQISPRNALVFAIILEVAAFVWLWLLVNLLSAVLAVCATLFYVFVYSLWLKRRSERNIVIGGAAGAVPVLVGWTAVTGRLDWAPLLLFAVIFYWTPPHFWALAVRYRDDYAQVAVPMLPAVRSIRTVGTAHHRLQRGPVGDEHRLRVRGRVGHAVSGHRPGDRRDLRRLGNTTASPWDTTGGDAPLQLVHHVCRGAVRGDGPGSTHLMVPMVPSTAEKQDRSAPVRAARGLALQFEAGSGPLTAGRADLAERSYRTDNPHPVTEFV